MKNLLIDSHELIWMLFEPSRIDKTTEAILASADIVYVSLASVWELAIKHNKGKLVYGPDELLEGVEALGAKLLQISPEHILALKNIKTFHADPFDRILLAQAKTENLLLITADTEILNLKFDYIVNVRS
ncbi:type II toxin-antitoxin system VapC family toxin [Candidatus Parcubacteria bacterium]|nr:type II toxin-antitoxin system VapC family toxin [Candidatus Parcubacteria bacterium]